jgi:hypothetical protein
MVSILYFRVFGFGGDLAYWGEWREILYTLLSASISTGGSPKGRGK